MKPTHRKILAALFIAWGLTACASMVDTRAEQIILQALPTLVGPAQTYRVRAVGAASSNGQLQAVDVEGRRIARAGAPVFDSAVVSLRDIRFDRTEKRVESIGAADAVVRVLANDVSIFLQSRPGVSDVHTQFMGSNEVSISARPSIAGLPLPAATRIQLTGNFVPDGPRLTLKVTRLTAAGIALGRLPQSLLESAINPIIDLSRLPAPAQIDAVRIENAALVIQASGVAAIPTIASSAADTKAAVSQ